MALQLFKIADSTVDSPVATVTFSSIPSGYTDLMLVASMRNTDSGGTIARLQFNGDSASNYTTRTVSGNGATASSYTASAQAYITYMAISCSSDTANTFGSTSIYIPNYTGSTQKSLSFDSVEENNATTGYNFLGAGLWSGTSAITSITLLNPGSTTFVANSTFTLYGVL